jgi:hypothetical protein
VLNYLVVLRPISLALQATEIDLLNAHTDAISVIDTLRILRENDHFDRLFQRASNISKAIHVDDFEPQIPRAHKYSNHRVNGPSTSAQGYYNRNVSRQFIGAVITQWEKF